jgi:hypothetical protein
LVVFIILYLIPQSHGRAHIKKCGNSEFISCNGKQIWAKIKTTTMFSMQSIHNYNKICSLVSKLKQDFPPVTIYLMEGAKEHKTSRF